MAVYDPNDGWEQHQFHWFDHIQFLPCCYTLLGKLWNKFCHKPPLVKSNILETITFIIRGNLFADSPHVGVLQGIRGSPMDQHTLLITIESSPIHTDESLKANVRQPLILFVFISRWELFFEHTIVFWLVFRLSHDLIWSLGIRNRSSDCWPSTFTLNSGAGAQPLQRFWV